MNEITALGALAGLAHESRLRVFRLLVRQGPGGLPAGEIAERLAIPGPTLSFHLKELARAGLVTSTQRGRFVIYAPDFAAMDGLLGFLTENCCQGTGACAPARQAVESATACHAPVGPAQATPRRSGGRG